MVDGRNIKVIMDDLFYNSCLGQLHFFCQTADNAEINNSFDTIDRNEQLCGSGSRNFACTAVNNEKLTLGHFILINLETELFDLFCSLAILAQNRTDLYGNKHTDLLHNFILLQF